MDFNNEPSYAGEKASIHQTVTEEMLEYSMNCGGTHTLSMASLVRLMEQAAYKLSERHVSEGNTTFGAMMNLTHTAPTVAGVDIYITAELLEISEGQLYFEITARDNMGIICEAAHQRVVVPKTAFDERAQMRSGFYEMKKSRRTDTDE